MLMEQQKLANHTNSHEDYRRAKRLRKSAPTAERILWDALRQVPKELAFRFRRQHPVHPYIADFACVACKLLIEIDGPSHDIRPSVDVERTRYLQDKGYTVVRYPNDEIYHNCQGVVEDVVMKAQELFRLQAATPPLTPPQGEGDL